VSRRVSLIDKGVRSALYELGPQRQSSPSPGKIKMAIDEASGLQVYGGLEQQDKQLHRTQSYSMDNSTQGMEDTVGRLHYG